jgi:hypothetical protein
MPDQENYQENWRAVYSTIANHLNAIMTFRGVLWTIFVTLFAGGIFLAASNTSITHVLSNPLTGTFGMAVSLAFFIVDLRLIRESNFLMNRAAQIEKQMPHLPAGMFWRRPETVIYSLAVDWLLYSVPFVLSLLVTLGFTPATYLLINGLVVYGISFILFLVLGLLIRYLAPVSSFFFYNSKRNEVKIERANEGGEPDVPRG